MGRPGTTNGQFELTARPEATIAANYATRSTETRGGSDTQKMSRHEFTRKTRRQAWDRCNELCEGLVDDHNHGFSRCNAPLMFGRFEYDHDLPDWMGGDNSLKNCVVLCLQCHRRKTARDQGKIAKSKRIHDRIIKAKTSKRPMPFGKRSRLKRKMDGTVVMRD